MSSKTYIKSSFYRKVLFVKCFSCSMSRIEILWSRVVNTDPGESCSRLPIDHFLSGH